MATLQNFDLEIAKTKQVVEEMRSKIEQSGTVLDTLAKADKNKPINVLYRRGEWAQYALIRPGR